MLRDGEEEDGEINKEEKRMKGNIDPADSRREGIIVGTLVARPGRVATRVATTTSRSHGGLECTLDGIRTQFS